MKINHESDSLTEALGMTDKRVEEIFTIFVESMRNARCSSERLENIHNNKSLNQAEKYYLVFRLGMFTLEADSAMKQHEETEEPTLKISSPPPEWN